MREETLRVFEGYGSYVACGEEMGVKKAVEGRKADGAGGENDSDAIDLEALPYRELQALAKRNGVRANLKKDAMIRAIQGQRAGDVAGPSHGARFAMARRRRAAALVSRARRAGWGAQIAASA